MPKLTKTFPFFLLSLGILAGFPAFGAEAEGGFGHLLREHPQGSIWWAEGTYKVFRETDVPKSRADAIKISAARNEYEPFQLVLRPTEEVPELNFVDVSNLKSDSGSVIAAENVEVNLVEYVKVEKPTDRLGHEGMYPDPLPPLLVWTGDAAGGVPRLGQTGSGDVSPRKSFRANLILKPGENQPLWFTVYVPSEARGGLYRGEIILTVGGWELEALPILLEVYDFVLSKETHTETAYGVYVNSDYHGLTSREDTERVHDLYMQDCARHRISPYDPMQFHRIQCRIDPKADDPDKRIQLDFSNFDKAAHRYLDEFAFTTFNFASIVSGFDISPQWSTEDEKKLKAEIIRRVCDHLAEKGWLRKAYDYWIDEPPPDKYQKVLEGMMFLKEADPRLRRLLTFCHDPAPVPVFYGGVNLWVPVLSLLHPDRAKERQALGETVWWYVCCGPHHPYPNNFIDHPAINHRIRFWMMEKFGTNGSLYWSLTYWAQNPWQTAMSYSPEGGTWGNGDGRLLYPPTNEKPDKPMVCSPITSIRFEMLREGLEDREYFYLLSQELERVKKETGSRAARAIAEAEKAMRGVDELVRSLTDYETDPQKLYAARAAMARAVEGLSSLSGPGRRVPAVVYDEDRVTAGAPAVK